MSETPGWLMRSPFTVNRDEHGYIQFNAPGVSEHRAPEHAAQALLDLRRQVDEALATDLPADRPVVNQDALAEVFSRHRYALGHEGILSDGEYAWLECTCGFKQNLALPQDDIRIAEAAWERHLADAVLTVVQDAADVRRAVAEPLLALADEMENPNTEHGTMPGVRMQVRQHWAGRIRAALNGQEQPSAGLGLTSAMDLLTDAERADLNADLARMAAQRRRAEAEARDVWLP